MKYRYKNSIYEVNLLYLVLGILLVTIGAYVQNKEVYFGLLITEYLLILLPSLLFLKLKGMQIRKVLKLNKISLKQVLLVIGITIFTYPIAVFFQAIFYAIINLFKEVTPSSVPMPNDGLQFLISFFIIALTPGICEEVLFRGVILNSYSRFGYKKSILISAIYFGLFHFNLLNFIGPTILGIIFGVMVSKTNSIYSSMIGHTINNGIALSIGFFINKYQSIIDEIIYESSRTTEIISVGIVDFIPLIFVLICFLIVKKLLNRLKPFDSYNLSESVITKEETFNYEDYNNKLDIEEILYLSEPFDKIKYLPVAIIIFMFIFFNWVNLFM